jgi:hypothetical protein
MMMICTALGSGMCHLRESVEKLAAELKRLYYKAYRNRDARTRQEDLLQRFLLGLNACLTV